MRLSSVAPGQASSPSLRRRGWPCVPPCRPLRFSLPREGVARVGVVSCVWVAGTAGAQAGRGANAAVRARSRFVPASEPVNPRRRSCPVRAVRAVRLVLSLSGGTRKRRGNSNERNRGRSPAGSPRLGRTARTARTGRCAGTVRNGPRQKGRSRCFVLWSESSCPSLLYASCSCAVRNLTPSRMRGRCLSVPRGR